MSDVSEKARARAKRFGHFSFSAHVREDIPEMRNLFNSIKNSKPDKHQKKMFKDHVKYTSAIAASQRICGPNLYADIYLRDFLKEYNGRLFAGEGIHMPSSWSVMRSFVEPDEKHMVLKLLPQDIGILSFNKLLDQLTDPNVNSDISISGRSLEELIIYQINMLGGHSRFVVPGSEDYVFCGMAFCREGKEISFIGVFGRTNPNPNKDKGSMDPANLNPDKPFLKEMAESIDLSDQPLFGDPNFVPVILLSRVNYETGKVQMRSALEETKDTFGVFSDDPQTFDVPSLFNKDKKEYIEKHLKRLEVYSPLYEIMHASPCCLDLLNNDDAKIERHPTGMRLDPKSRDAKLASILPLSDAPRYVNVKVLYDIGQGSESYNIRSSNLSMETSGYWKTLEMGVEGRDKNDNPVQGKTWVTTKISWYEDSSLNSKPFGKSSKINTRSDDDTGYVYVMRNASHGKDIYKIGFTTKPVDDRASQLGATSGQPDFFSIVQDWHVKSPRLIEQSVHSLLAEYRVTDRREFFYLKYAKIRETIERVINLSNAEIEE